MRLEMTEERKRRAQEALEETERHLAKEMKYRENLRDQKLVSFYQNHIIKLQGMLNSEFVEIGE